ncbi:flagellar biosynthetic protein FliO [Candidatus Enterovibrio altilux]|uniref:Flagellar protein n=1 Tax=Candidatus Enterovibrio altilux TaxID=1927128 RepID=A0A291B870_9GAMM|nr:flagellar biosynthetic protein FliO [Candidatus Enterovibrio luxaltus]ATF09195.1 Flagellar biosynthesis protein FliO [Candidatus Enterovibrio luxaltus]
MILMLLAVFGSLFASAAFAASTSHVNFTTMLAALLAVISLIFTVAWLFKRMKIPILMGAKPGLKVISQLPLGQKGRVIVLDVNGEQVLIGVTVHQITLLKTLDTRTKNDESASKAPNLDSA